MLNVELLPRLIQVQLLVGNFRADRLVRKVVTRQRHSFFCPLLQNLGRQGSSNVGAPPESLSDQLLRLNYSQECTSGFSDLRCNTNEPPGWSILTYRPVEALRSTRLKAVFLIRVAIMRSLSKGALAIENARELPSASVSGGFSKVRSID